MNDVKWYEMFNRKAPKYAKYMGLTRDGDLLVSTWYIRHTRQALADDVVCVVDGHAYMSGARLSIEFPAIAPHIERIKGEMTRGLCFRAVRYGRKAKAEVA